MTSSSLEFASGTAAAPAPQIYADANLPIGLVAFMRAELHWDVLFVMEQPALRRAPDTAHFRLARQLRRTLVSLDRDYLDDRRFPLAQSAGVLVVAAAGEAALATLLRRVDAGLFRAAGVALPLEGRKLHAQTDWHP